MTPSSAGSLFAGAARHARRGAAAAATDGLPRNIPSHPSAFAAAARSIAAAQHRHYRSQRECAPAFVGFGSMCGSSGLTSGAAGKIGSAVSSARSRIILRPAHQPWRSLSDYSFGPPPSSSSSSGLPRGYPQYSVYDTSSVLTLRPVSPTYKSTSGGGGIVVDMRGYVLLEFVPRADTLSSAEDNKDDGRRSSRGRMGAPQWDEGVKFALSAEECGLVADQIPRGAPVELSRRAVEVDHLSGDGVGGGRHNVPNKVLRMKPGEYGAVSLTVDLVSENGVGGQQWFGTRGSGTVPQTVTVQAGEFEVILSLLRSSMPYLLGWNTLMDTEFAHRIALVRSGGRGAAAGRSRSRTDEGGGYGKI